MVVGDYREDGTEDLLPGDAHVATDVGDDRRSHPEPVREFINAHCSAAERHGRALRTCAFDVTEDAVALFGVDGRAQVSIPIPGGPNDNRLRSRHYAVDAHGNESLAVARAAGKAADDIERVQSELRTLRADATELQMTIDGLTNTVVPTSSCLPTEALIAEMQLQPRLDAILAEANAVDAELATAINIADGDTPIPPGPHDNRPEIQNALSQPLPEDPIKFADLWNQLTPEEKDWLYSQDHDIGNHPGMPWDPSDLADPNNFHLGKDHYNRLHLPELELQTQADIDRMQHSLDELMADHNADDGAIYAVQTQLATARNHLQGYKDVEATLSKGGPKRYLGQLDEFGHGAIAINNPDAAKRNAILVPGTGQDLTTMDRSKTDGAKPMMVWQRWLSAVM
jgi:hypothetical protein